MAIIPIKIPDVLIPEVKTRFCGEFNYREEIQVPVLDNEGNPTYKDGGIPITELTPNPETKVDFVHRMIVDFVKGVVLSGRKKIKDAEFEVSRQADIDEVEAMDIT